MACEFITKSRLLECKTGFSGIKAVGFIPFQKLVLTANDVFEGAGLTGSVYRYELKNDGNSYEEDGTPDRTAGTAVWTGTLNIVLPSLDRATRDELKLLAYGRPQIFLELFNGNILLAGAEQGCEMTSMKTATGGARKDMAGYTLAFSTEERRPIVFVGATGSTLYNSSINLTGAINPS